MRMTLIIIGPLILSLLVIGTITYFYKKHKKTSLNKHYFQSKWRKLQKLCLDQKTWYMAIIDADKLLDEALSKRHFSGKSTGEKLVSAQRELTMNKEIWFAHNLKKKIIETSNKKLGKKETTIALNAFRQALCDLGAISLKRKAIRKPRDVKTVKRI